MGETLFNWLVLIASFATLVAIAWLGFRDLRSLGESRPSSSVAPPAPDWTPSPEPAPLQPDTSIPRLRVEYHQNGTVEMTQQILAGETAYIGTEACPALRGQGILVRHASITYAGGQFHLLNRDASRGIAWEDETGASGELPPHESMPLSEPTELRLNEWRIRLEGET